MTFTLHPNLSTKIFITEKELCLIFLENNRHYPWLIIVPKRNQISKIIDLSEEDQLLLTKELSQIQKILWQLFSPTQLNVAAIGNKTPQLHIHVIARYNDDPAWPHTVWDHPSKEPYDELSLQNLVEKLQIALLQ